MKKANAIICVSGGFDPLHGGHLALFREAAAWGNLTVILNSDEWLIRKKGFHFLPWVERSEIIHGLSCVSHVAAVDDSGDTVCEALRRIKPRYFANGGDRKPGNTPEMEVCNELGIEMLWSIGGNNKANSSSDIARRAWVIRDWGRYVTLDEGDGYKIKKLVINPGQATSVQWHTHRSEFWYVAASDAHILLDNKSHIVKQGADAVVVEPGTHHQLRNKGAQQLVVIEVQTGSYLAEDDIVRVAVDGSDTILNYHLK
jgi:D-beta-D-heptose 7-phosphate kinase/D-beta-D-heptose 1-phosphate adenosyltransferase